MILSDIFKVTRGTKVILAITFSVSAAAIIFAFFYYRSINRSEDPRIEAARRLLTEFENMSAETEGIESFLYLDSAFSIFNRLPDYRLSFETGVIYNNKCSALLMKAIYDSTISLPEKQTLLDLSLKYCDSSIMIYEGWIRSWGTLTEEDIQERISTLMNRNDPAFYGLNFEKIFQKRIRNIILAQTETPRRLSVSLTNRGTIFRHLSMPDSALHYFNQALSLWKDNRIAESNRSVLMGGEPVKPSVIESLFPPDRNKN
jgi:hypothetical protein